MRTVLMIFGIWLLLNVLFVVVMAPPRKPRKCDASRSSDAKLARATINKEAYPFEEEEEEEEETSLSLIIVSIVMGTFFVLTQAVDAVRNAFKTSPPN